MRIKKLSGLTALVGSIVTGTVLLFSNSSHAYNNHRHSNFNNNPTLNNYSTSNSPTPYFNYYHPQDDSSNRQSNLNGNIEDFPFGFAALTIAMLATMYFMIRKGKSSFNS